MLCAVLAPSTETRDQIRTAIATSAVYIALMAHACIWRKEYTSNVNMHACIHICMYVYTCITIITSMYACMYTYHGRRNTFYFGGG